MRRRQRRGGGKQLQGEISGIGGRGGDGLLAPQPGMDGPVFVPLTVPGDEVRVQTTSRSASGTQSEILELLREGPDRVEPPCPHFGACGMPAAALEARSPAGLEARAGRRGRLACWF